MKILCLSYFNLARISSGASVRARGIFQLLAQLGKTDVVFASPYGDDLSDPALPLPGLDLVDVVQFRPTGKKSVIGRLRHEFDPRFTDASGHLALPADRQRLEKLLARYDLVWVHGLPVANGFALWRWPNSVLDLDDVPSSVAWKSVARSSGFSKLRDLRQAVLWRRREATLLERFDAICVCTEADRCDLGRRLGDERRVFVLPNGFAKPERQPVRHLADPPRIGFIGHLQHAPNRQGLSWFLNDVWPKVARNAPATTLRIVGRGSDTEGWTNGANVEPLGWVQDAAAEMATWAFTVVPIFEGGGTRVKTAEAFSRKCPVVSTTLGVEGYDVGDGHEVFIADSAAEFAEKCLWVLEHPETAAAVAERAWQKFMEHWTWDSYAGRVQEVVDYVLQGSGRRGSTAELVMR